MDGRVHYTECIVISFYRIFLKHSSTLTSALCALCVPVCEFLCVPVCVFLRVLMYISHVCISCMSVCVCVCVCARAFLCVFMSVSPVCIACVCSCLFIMCVCSCLHLLCVSPACVRSSVYLISHVCVCVFVFLCVSRACRLKKKAQYEANKVKLWGLSTEYGTLPWQRQHRITAIDCMLSIYRDHP